MVFTHQNTCDSGRLLGEIPDKHGVSDKTENSIPQLNHGAIGEGVSLTDSFAIDIGAVLAVRILYDMEVPFVKNLALSPGALLVKYNDAGCLAAAN